MLSSAFFKSWNPALSVNKGLVTSNDALFEPLVCVFIFQLVVLVHKVTVLFFVDTVVEFQPTVRLLVFQCR